MSTPNATETRTAAVGVVLYFQPARDTVASVEIQRDTDSGGSPAGSPVTAGIVGAGARTFTDIIGGTGPYHYRGRHIRSGATEGAWSSYVKAKPTLLAEQLPNIPQTAEVTGCEISFDANGYVVASVAGDLDTDNIYITVGDGSAPSDPTAASNHGTVAARSGTITTTQKITTGNDAYVKAVAANAFASLGEVRTFRAARRLGPFAKDTSARTVTGTTSETSLDTETVIANKLGANGGVRYEMRFTSTGTAGSKGVTIYWNGALKFTIGLGSGSALSAEIEVLLFNNAATNVQYMTVLVHRTNGDTLLAENTAAVDTTANVDLEVRGTLGNAGDALTLQRSFISYVGTN